MHLQQLHSLTPSIHPAKECLLRGQASVFPPVKWTQKQYGIGLSWGSPM